MNLIEPRYAEEFEQPDQNSYFLHRRNPDIEAYMDENFHRIDARRRWVPKSALWPLQRTRQGRATLICDVDHPSVKPLNLNQTIILINHRSPGLFGNRSPVISINSELGEIWQGVVQPSIIKYDPREFGFPLTGYDTDAFAVALARFLGHDEIIAYGNISLAAILDDPKIRVIDPDKPPTFGRTARKRS
ncbi:MAG: hypothetical protein HC888_00035 [Candidatus Competibacteraceae bacterium]|nr:hypothetical protein [Candidatus Competibacteraceae bacterium]